MEKAGLIVYALRACRWYLVAFHILFFFWGIVVFLACLFDGTSIKDYCIRVESGESYDIVWGQSTLCRINWPVLLKEISTVALIAYVVFSGPVWLIKFLLRPRKIRHRV